MKFKAFLLIAVLGLTGQAAPAPSRHLVYQFGYNTPVAKQGNGTGTTIIDIEGPAKDGGIVVSGQDRWWNMTRPRAVNTCEVYSGGRVACSKPPYAISPIQLTLFPLLAKRYFRAASAGTTTWTRAYTMYAALLPGSSGFASAPNTWDCTVNLQEKGPISKAGGAVLILSQGTMVQRGGRFWKATSKQRIAYDPAAGVPLAVRDVRTHIPARTVYNNDLIELKLIKDSSTP